MGKKNHLWRSGCPLNASVEMLGDRWSLLIIRDMMLRGATTFKDFLSGFEKIATNVLADRLKRLESFGVIEKRKDERDGRKTNYELTQKGIDLAPVLTEMVLWAAEHEETENPGLVAMMKKDRKEFEARIREEWERRRGEKAKR
jgi:DNA-binding HxlR family transcriptional regulator